jgi:hypothetical protein
MDGQSGVVERPADARQKGRPGRFCMLFKLHENPLVVVPPTESPIHMCSDTLTDMEKVYAMMHLLKNMGLSFHAAGGVY